MTAHTRSTDSPVMTFREACAYLKRGRTWLKQRADQIGCIRDGGRLAFFRDDLDQWLSSHRSQAVEAPAPAVTPIRARPRRVRYEGVSPISGRPRRVM